MRNKEGATENSDGLSARRSVSEIRFSQVVRKDEGGIEKPEPRREFLVGISADEGQSWKFAAGESLSIAIVRQTLPVLPAEIAGEFDERDNQVVNRLAEIIVCIREYQELKGRLPDHFKSPLLREIDYSIAKDGWGNELVYRITNSGFELRSSGRDGKIDTNDDIACNCPRTL